MTKELIPILIEKKEADYPAPLHYILLFYNSRFLLNFSVIIEFFVVLICHSI
jgi:hypothetical protein